MEVKEIIEKIRKFLEEKEKLDLQGCLVVADLLQKGILEDLEEEAFEEDVEVPEEEDDLFSTEEEPDEGVEVPEEEEPEVPEPPVEHKKGIRKIIKKPQVKVKRDVKTKEQVDDGDF